MASRGRGVKVAGAPAGPRGATAVPAGTTRAGNFRAPPAYPNFAYRPAETGRRSHHEILERAEQIAEEINRAKGALIADRAADTR